MLVKIPKILHYPKDTYLRNPELEIKNLTLELTRDVEEEKISALSSRYVDVEADDDSIEIFIKTPSEQTLTLRTDLGDTIDTMTEKIKEATGHDPVDAVFDFEEKHMTVNVQKVAS